MLKINIKLRQDLPQVEICLYLGYLLRQDNDFFHYRGVTASAWNSLSVGAWKS